jgi:hypothetical protein
MSLYPGLFRIPSLGGYYNSTGATATTFTLNETGDRVELIFQAAAAMTITRLLFRTGGTLTGSPSCNISLQGVNQFGRADGVIKGATNNAQGTQVPATNTTYWVTLNESYACTLGETLCIVITNTVAASSISINIGGSTPSHHMPRACTFDNATSTYTLNGIYPMYGYSNGITNYGTQTVTGSTGLNTSSATLREAGNKFRFINHFHNATLIGINTNISVAAGVSVPFDIMLYDGGGASDLNILASGTFNNNQVLGSGITTGRPTTLFFTNPVVIYPNQFYRATIKSKNTNNVTIQFLQNINDITDYNSIYQDIYYTQRASSNWTDDTTDKVNMDFIFSEISIFYNPIIRPLG